MDALLKKRVGELLKRFQNQDTLLYTGFLSPAEQAEAEVITRREPGARFSGGYEGAERRALLFVPEWETQPEGAVFAAVRVTAAFSKGLTHRDYLGALLGLGIERSRVGDILVAPDGAAADVVVLLPMAPFLMETITMIGRFPAKAQALPLGALMPMGRSVKAVSATVQQPRFDSVAALAFGLSRSRMGELIDQGTASLNHEICLRRERLVEEGDTLSVRGLGRARVAKIGGRSKKDRLWVELERLL